MPRRKARFFRWIEEADERRVQRLALFEAPEQYRFMPNAPAPFSSVASRLKARLPRRPLRRRNRRISLF